MITLLKVLVSIFWNFSAVFDARLLDLAPKYFMISIIKNTNIRRYPASLAAEK